MTAADILRDWTIVTSGVISQQLSNAPDDSFETGRFTTAIPNIVAMFVNSYAAPKSAARKSSKTETGNRHADKR